MEKKCKVCEDIKDESEFYRYESGSLYARCKKCQNEYSVAWTQEHPDKNRTRSRKYKSENRPLVLKSLRRGRLMREYGITQEQYDEMHERQNGLCAICGKPETATLKGRIKRLSVDHNHTTGEVRKLLCGRCNAAVGFVNEDLSILDKMRKYLEENYGHG